MIILSSFLLAASMVYLWCLGLNEILRTLGWSTLLLPVAWVGLYVSTRAKVYRWSILSFTVMLFGFVLLNQMGIFVLHKTIPIESVWSVLMQMAVVWLPFVSMVSSITKKPIRDFRIKEGIDFFSMWFTWLGLWSMTMFFPLWADTPSLSKSLFLICAPTLLYSSLVFVMFIRLTGEELEYLMNAPARVPRQAKHFKRIAVAFFVLTVGSLALEVFRGMWIFALTGCSSLLFLSANIYLIHRRIFLSLPSQANKPSVFHFPLSYLALLIGTLSLPAWFVLCVLFRRAW